jgi:membrane-bound ClpP family serine protease
MLKHYLPNGVFYYFYLLEFHQMKIFTYTLVFLAIALIVFNITLLDFDHLLEGDSMIALIGIAASICAVFILLIFRMSKMVEEKLNDK